MKKLILTTLLLICVVRITTEQPIERTNFIIPVIPKPDLTKLEEIDTIVTDLSVLHPAFRNEVIELIHECARQGIRIRIQETYRSVNRQNKLKRLGLKVTSLNGKESRHQYGLAIDIVPYIEGKLAWNEETLYKIGMIGEHLGLGWGGRWRRPYDPGHFEWKTTTEDLLSNRLPTMPDTIKIPI